MSSFCKHCGNILDISRNAPNKDTGDEDTPIDVSDTDNVIDMESIIDRLNEGEQLSQEEISGIDFIALQRHEYFQKKSVKDKRKIKKIIDQLVDRKDTTDGNASYYVCKSCSYYEPIKSGQLILSRSNESSTSADMEIPEKYKNHVFSKTLPRTREYNCPNKSCSTHTGATREAVFFRIRNTTQTYYGCKLCHEVWKIS